MVVLLALIACSPACGDDDDDDSTNEGAAGAASEQWTCELDGVGDCHCRRDPIGSLDACAGTLPCCLHYVVAGDGGEICSCRNADETECAELLMAAEDQQGERVPKCPP
jgi:hypothetical protein